MRSARVVVEREEREQVQRDADEDREDDGATPVLGNLLGSPEPEDRVRHARKDPYAHEPDRMPRAGVTDGEDGEQTHPDAHREDEGATPLPGNRGANSAPARPL